MPLFQRRSSRPSAARPDADGVYDMAAGEYAAREARFEDLKSRVTARVEEYLAKCVVVPVACVSAGFVWANGAALDDPEVMSGVLESAEYWWKWGGPWLASHAGAITLASVLYWMKERVPSPRRRKDVPVDAELDTSDWGEPTGRPEEVPSSATACVPDADPAQ